ncbi:MAG: hypothetical protein ACRC17_00610 [Culicoidibacterales bacterium]
MEQFKSSINIKFDLGKEEIFGRYIATAAHAAAFRGILSGFVYRGTKTQIIYGAYGTGKSLLGTVISSMVCQTISKPAITALADKFNAVDTEIHDDILKLNRLKRKYIPVILNGNNGDLREALLQAILAAINADGTLELYLPGAAAQIEEIIHLWEQHYPTTYQAFIKELKNHEQTVESLRSALRNMDYQAIELFKTIYPTLTSGMKFVEEVKGDFLTNVEFIAQKLEAHNLGLYIIYDEFGRYLQAVNEENIYRTMQDLQDIAELFNNQLKNIHLTIITHMSLRNYFTGFDEKYQNEFQRIEKRFKVFNIYSDNTTFLRIAANVIKAQVETVPTIADHTRQAVRKFGLFTQFNDTEKENIILTDAYPIHPTTLELLPQISAVFGQNERTLFTFLESQEADGLQGFLRNHQGYYYPDQLLNYFSVDFESVQLETHAQKLFELFNRASAKLQTELEARILKFIFIWDISGLAAKYPVTAEFVEFALGEHEGIETSLQALKAIKAIRFNEIENQWQLFEGSSINLEKLLLSKKTPFLLQTVQKQSNQELQTLLDHQFYFAKRYNIQKSMTRYAQVHVRINPELAQLPKITSEADLNIVYILTDKYLDTYQAFVENDSCPKTLYQIVKLNVKKIQDQIADITILKQLLKDRELLMNHPHLDEELLLAIRELEFKVKKECQKVESFTKASYWYQGDQAIKLKSRADLENYLTTYFESTYQYTPIIKNDMFNKNKIANVQQKAAMKILDSLLDKQQVQLEQLGITGKGPDFLIYTTTFKNHQVDFKNYQEITPEYQKIREVIIHYFQTHQEQGTLIELFDLLAAEPFGIRPAVIPLLVFGLALDKWETTLIYNNDEFIANFGAKEIYECLETRNSAIKIVYNEIDDTYANFLQQLETHLADQISEYVQAKSTYVRVCSGLYNWMNAQAFIMQSTDQLSPKTLTKLRDVIKQSIIDPKATITYLYSHYADDFGQLVKDLEKLAKFLQTYIKKQQKAVLETSQLTTEQLPTFVNEQSAVIRKTYRLLEVMEQNPKTFYEVYGEQIIGIDSMKWTNVTFETITKQIMQDLQAITQSQTGENVVKIVLENQEYAAHEVELTRTANNIYRNIQMTLDNSKRRITAEELDTIIIEIMRNYLNK